MDGRLLKGQETKEKIIIATLHYIADHGMKGMSAQKIARLAGVSKSNIFHHFESLDRVPLEAMEWICDRMTDAITEPGQDLRSFLIGLGDATFTLCDQEIKLFKALFTLYNESFHDDRYKGYLTKMKEDFASSLVNAIEVVESCKFNSDFYDLCKLITIIIDGMGMHFMVDLDVKAYQKMWAIQVEMLLVAIESYKK